MRKFIIFLTIFIFTTNLVGCSKMENSTSNNDKVKINLPKDNTVNGYRLENYYDSSQEMPDFIKSEDVGVGTNNNNSSQFCGNKNSKIFHKNTCDSVSKMKSENKFYASKDELLNNGYKSCGKCNP